MDAQLYVKQRSQSSVLIKPRKTRLNAAINLFMGLLCIMCYIQNKSRGEDHFFTRQPYATAVRGFSSVFFFKYRHYACSVLRSRNSRKAFKFLSKRLVLLLYGNQYRNLCFVHKTTYLWSTRSPGGGELSLSACPGVGNRPPNENKIANPRGYARGGGMVTGRIEPCITQRETMGRKTIVRTQRLMEKTISED